MSRHGHSVTRKTTKVAHRALHGGYHSDQFTDEELDFIINHDIEYRMGLSAGGQP